MEIQTVYTSNVIADTNFNNEDATATIVVGSHLDSVPAGAGINDNGSGSATNLEMALDLYRNPPAVCCFSFFCFLLFPFPFRPSTHLYLGRKSRSFCMVGRRRIGIIGKYLLCQFYC